MGLFLAQYEWQGYRVKGLIPDLVIPLKPLPDWPQGRKGQATADAWADHRSITPAGLLVMDNDIAADPGDLAAMLEAVDQRPDAVHVGLVKLWPASTGRPDWIWSHRGGTLGSPIPHRVWLNPIAYFATGFTWLPSRLLDLASPQLRECTFPEFDVCLSEVALRHGIRTHSVPACFPKHLHF